MRSRIQFIQFLSYAAMMASMIIIPLLSRDLGASDFVIGPFLGGLVSQFYGYRGNMFFASILAAIAFLILLGGRRFPPQDVIMWRRRGA